MIDLDLHFYVRPEHYIEILDWCIENFGKSNNRITWDLLANNEIGGDIYFKNEEDAVAFKLRWY